MKLPTVEKFLFCFDLKTGGLALGYLYAGTTGIGAVKLLIDLIFDAEQMKDEMFSDEKSLEHMLPAAEIVGKTIEPMEGDKKMSTFGKVFKLKVFIRLLIF